MSCPEYSKLKDTVDSAQLLILNNNNNNSYELTARLSEFVETFYSLEPLFLLNPDNNALLQINNIVNNINKIASKIDGHEPSPKQLTSQSKALKIYTKMLKQIKKSSSQSEPINIPTPSLQEETPPQPQKPSPTHSSTSILEQKIKRLKQTIQTLPEPPILYNDSAELKKKYKKVKQFEQFQDTIKKFSIPKPVVSVELDHLSTISKNILKYPLRYMALESVSSIFTITVRKSSKQKIIEKIKSTPNMIKLFTEFEIQYLYIINIAKWHGQDCSSYKISLDKIFKLTCKRMFENIKDLDSALKLGLFPPETPATSEPSLEALTNMQSFSGIDNYYKKKFEEFTNFCTVFTDLENSMQPLINMLYYFEECKEYLVEHYSPIFGGGKTSSAIIYEAKIYTKKIISAINELNEVIELYNNSGFFKSKNIIYARERGEFRPIFEEATKKCPEYLDRFLSLQLQLSKIKAQTKYVYFGPIISKNLENIETIFYNINIFLVRFCKTYKSCDTILSLSQSACKTNKHISQSCQLLMNLKLSSSFPPCLPSNPKQFSPQVLSSEFKIVRGDAIPKILSYFMDIDNHSIPEIDIDRLINFNNTSRTVYTEVDKLLVPLKKVNPSIAHSLALNVGTIGKLLLLISAIVVTIL